MARCLLALGSNLGNREENLTRAGGEVASLRDSQLLARSRWWATTPIGGPSGQGTFLNGSLVVETRLDPAELSHALHDIERRLGRERVVRWDARVIDIDLLLYDSMRVDSPELTVPHPRMTFRRFVLEPACEIAGSMVEPTIGWTLAQLLRHLDSAPRYVSVTAGQPQAATRLAGEICKALGSPCLEELFPTAASGDDSAGAEGVELTTWRKNPQLAARLSRPAEPTLTPVVSGCWTAAVPGKIQPALTIVWEDGSAGESRRATDRGPIAKITGSDFPTVLSEAIAAIRAVWPGLPAT